MKCGFYKDGDTEKCKKVHIGPCKQCTDSFDVLVDMFSFHDDVTSTLRESGDLSRDLALDDDLASWKKDIEQCLRNLLDFRNHIAQKEDESAFDSVRYCDLKSNECIVIMDYKMKILSSSFREPQSDWFSKRGFSCLGALLIFGSSEADTENKVLYHFFISDDTTQDSEAINCAKQ